MRVLKTYCDICERRIQSVEDVFTVDMSLSEYTKAENHITPTIQVDPKKKKILNRKGSYADVCPDCMKGILNLIELIKPPANSKTVNEKSVTVQDVVDCINDCVMKKNTQEQ